MHFSRQAHPNLPTDPTGDTVYLTIGPYRVRMSTNIPTVIQTLRQLYADYPCCDARDVVDFHVRVETPRSLRRWYRPQAQFLLDGYAPFKPLPLSQAYPFFEWGLNWCIASHSHQYLILHAAVVERHGQAVILPAPPGSGKSTLCAGLVARGWRLLSDELALLSFDSGWLTPVPRPISLKNQSIDIIAEFAPSMMLGPRCADTAKGTVAHVRPPADSVAGMHELARPAALVLPQYRAGAETTLSALSRGRMMMHLASNSFNYNVHGSAGFDLLANLVEHTACLQFHYSRLDEAISVFDQLVAGYGA